jgi:monoamine oxidase
MIHAHAGVALCSIHHFHAERQMFALPYKRVFFAGEHTSAKWQGYMNAVESDFRAAEEMFATMQSLTPLF